MCFGLCDIGSVVKILHNGQMFSATEYKRNMRGADAISASDIKFPRIDLTDMKSHCRSNLIRRWMFSIDGRVV